MMSLMGRKLPVAVKALMPIAWVALPDAFTAPSALVNAAHDAACSVLSPLVAAVTWVAVRLPVAYADASVCRLGGRLAVAVLSSF